MNFPVQYVGANVPQAWAAGAAFMQSADWRPQTRYPFLA